MRASSAPSVRPALSSRAVRPLDRFFARKHHGGDHWRIEPRAFLVGPVDHLDRALRANAGCVQRAQHLEAGEHAQNAIEAAARRLRVEVAADQYRSETRLAAFAAHEHGAEPINRDGTAEVTRPPAKQVAHCAVVIAERQSPQTAIRPPADRRRGHDRRPEPVAVDREIACHASLQLSCGGPG